LAKIQKVSKAQIIRLALRDFAEENGLMTTRLRMRNKAAAE
jgi:predicted O-linked N-acetylglucosamine transferase (SPINDLY family)